MKPSVIFFSQPCRPLTQMVLRFPNRVLPAPCVAQLHSRYIIHYLESCCFNVILTGSSSAGVPKVRTAACCWQQLPPLGLSRFLCFEAEAGRLFNTCPVIGWADSGFWLLFCLWLQILITHSACNGCIQFCALEKGAGWGERGDSQGRYVCPVSSLLFP